MGWEELSNLLEAREAKLEAREAKPVASNAAKKELTAKTKIENSRCKSAPIVQASYLGAGRAKQLNLALKVAKIKHAKPVVVFGPAGIGKSTMLKDIGSRVLGLRPLVIVEGCQAEFKSVLLGLARGLGCSHDNLAGLDVLALKSLIVDELKTIDEQRPVLILCDDAEELTAEAMSELLAFCVTYQSKMSLMLFVATCESNTLRADLRRQEIYGMALEPLGISEIAEYLAYNAMAKNEQCSDLTDEGVLYIFEQSEGVPKRVNKLHDYVQTMLKQGVLPWATSEICANRDKSNAPRVKKVTENLGVTVVVGALGIFSAIGLLSDSNGGMANTYGEATKPKLELVASGAASMQLGLDVRSIALETLPVTPSEPAIVMAVAEVNIVSGEASVQESAQVHADVLADSKRAVKHSTVDLVEDLIKDQGAEHQAKTQPFSTDETLLLNMDSGFVLQLAALPEKKAVERFVSDYKLGRLSIHRSLINGNTWYKVVSTGFADRRAVITFIDTLPKSLKESRPWVRPVEAVKSEIVRFEKLALSDKAEARVGA